MKKLLTLLFIVITFNTFGQTPTYLDSIYPIQVQTNIQYGKAKNITGVNQNLYMDKYSPIGIDFIDKPVILLFHGGGLISGSKNEARIVAEAKYFAGCGYVVFLVDYRLGWTISQYAINSIKNSHKAYYRAVQDGFAAIRYVNYYSSDLGVDTSNVFVGGTSAGGLIAVALGYLDQNEVESFYTGQLKTSGNGVTKYANTNIKGIISYWGGVFDTTIFNGESIPNICFHGDLDEVIYYNYGLYQGQIPIYGGYKVNQKSLDNNIPSILHTFYGSHHGVPFPSIKWDSCITETKYWLKQQITPIQQTTPRVVLSEYICATTCAPCTIFSPVMRNLMSINASKVAYTERHTNIPSADVFYTQGNPYTQWYKNFNGITGNPIFYWDGKFHFTNDANQVCFDSIQIKPSYLQISSLYHLNPLKDSVFITVTLNALDTISGNLYLHTNIKFGDIPNYNAYAFSAIYGELSIPTLYPNQSIIYTFKEKIPTSYTLTYNRDSLKVITYVQSHTNSNPIVNDPPTHEVFNSCYGVREILPVIPVQRLGYYEDINPTVYIYDLNGREIYRGLSIPELPIGFYLVRQGSKTYKKAVIQ